MHTKETLKADLARMGLKPEQTVLIHSSMRAIGEVEKRADGVLDALMEYFAPGLLVLPTLTYNKVNADQPVFSEKNTPCCTGILPELFRQRTGVCRSLHPTHSVAAAGKEAKEFVSGHENSDSPAHRNSPWGKLYDRNAVIMFIGATLYSNTFLHGVEEWLPVPGMLTETPQNLIIECADGRRIPRSMRRHLGQHSRWYGILEETFRAENALSDGKFGDAHVYVLDARKAGDIVYALLKKTPLFFTQEYQEKC